MGLGGSLGGREFERVKMSVPIEVEKLKKTSKISEYLFFSSIKLVRIKSILSSDNLL